VVTTAVRRRAQGHRQGTRSADGAHLPCTQGGGDVPAGRPTRKGTLRTSNPSREIATWTIDGDRRLAPEGDVASLVRRVRASGPVAKLRGHRAARAGRRVDRCPSRGGVWVAGARQAKRGDVSLSYPSHRCPSWSSSRFPRDRLVSVLPTRCRDRSRPDRDPRRVPIPPRRSARDAGGHLRGAAAYTVEPAGTRITPLYADLVVPTFSAHAPLRSRGRQTLVNLFSLGANGALGYTLLPSGVVTDGGTRIRPTARSASWRTFVRRLRGPRSRPVKAKRHVRARGANESQASCRWFIRAWGCLTSAPPTTATAVKRPTAHSWFVSDVLPSCASNTTPRFNLHAALPLARGLPLGGISRRRPFPPDPGRTRPIWAKSRSHSCGDRNGPKAPKGVLT
jgi:hypothetical protein